MKKPVIIGLISCGGLVVLGGMAILGTLMYIGMVSPGTSVQYGHAVKQQYITKMRDLHLIGPGERIHFFYSDAILDIEDGMYVLTDRKLFLYSQTWEEPFVPIEFHEIQAVSLQRDDSFFTDSTLTVDLKNGDAYWFPLSSEQFVDVAFAEKLKVLSNIEETPAQ